MKKILLLIISLIFIISCTACNNKSKNNKEISTRPNLINENNFYKEGIIENNIYTNKSINLSITIPQKYILFEKEDFKHLNSDITTYEVYGQTEDETASISIVAINNEKSSALMYIEGLKQKLKEENKKDESKSKYIILDNELKILENKALYTLRTKTLINNEYYNQNYSCTDKNNKIFCIISIFNDNKSDLNEELNNNIKYIK